MSEEKSTAKKVGIPFFGIDPAMFRKEFQGEVPDKLCYTEDGSMTAQAQVMFMMGLTCGFYEITEKNYIDISERISFWEEFNGPLLRNSEDGQPQYIESVLVRAFIGMTPRSAKKSLNTFRTEVYRNTVKKAGRQVDMMLWVQKQAMIRIRNMIQDKEKANVIGAAVQDLDTIIFDRKNVELFSAKYV